MEVHGKDRRAPDEVGGGSLDFRSLVPRDMAERLERAVGSLSDAGRVRILSHHDADGIVSAAILATCIHRRGKGFHISLLKSMDEAVASQLAEEGNAAVLVSDMGSGELELLEGVGSKVVILDHHKVQRDSQGLIQINPHLYGIDGGDDLCGSMLSFLFAIATDQKNSDLLGPAIAGAIADKQHLGGFKGVNARIVDDAKARGLLSARKGLLLEGPAGETLASSVDPFFGFDRAAGLGDRLSAMGIGPGDRIEELEPGRAQALTSFLAMRLAEQGARSEALENMVGDIYRFRGMEKSLNTFSEDLNACGRMREEALGLRLCLGDCSAPERIRKLRQGYEQRIMEQVQKLKAEGLFKKDNIQFFYCGEPRLAGALAGIFMQYFQDQARPTFGISVLEKRTKVSCRGSKYLVSRNLDLATACRESAVSLGGKGGGHSIAAGAVIPKGKEEKFLELVDKAVGAQLAGKHD